MQAATEKMADLEGQLEEGQKLEASGREAMREQAEQQESGMRLLREELQAASSRAEDAETKMAGLATSIRVKSPPPSTTKTLLRHCLTFPFLKRLYAWANGARLEFDDFVGTVTHYHYFGPYKPSRGHGHQILST